MLNDDGTAPAQIGGVKTFILQDPTTSVVTQPSYAIFKGGLDNNFQQYPSNSFSDTMIQFSVTTPSPQLVLDRNLYVGIPIKFTGVGDTGDDNVFLLNYGSLDALRAYPLSSVTTTLSIIPNNHAISIPMNDVMPFLARYTGFEEDEIRYFSQFPSYQDRSQSYSELINSTINPLGGYPGASTPYHLLRGEYPCRIISNTRTGFEVIFYFVEPLFLSPLLFKKEKQPGFYGMQNININFTLESNLTKMWSRALTDWNALSSFTATMTGLQVGIPGANNTPTLYCKYAKPNVTLPLELPYHSPYAVLDRFQTNVGVIGARASFNKVTSQSLQLSSIPKRVYVLIRRRNQDRTYLTTDTMMTITNVNVTFDNSQRLSTASAYDLYQMSFKNGYQGTWMDWLGFGGPINPDGSRTSSFGSLLAIDFGDDIGLPLNQAPGMTGTYQLVIDVSGYNPANEPIDAVMYLITIQEGVFYTQNTQAFTATGTVTEADIANSGNLAVHDNLHTTFYGNGIFDVIKKGIGTAAKAFVSASPYLSTGLAVGSALAKGLTGGRKRKHYSGGANMSVADLRRRLRE